MDIEKIGDIYTYQFNFCEFAVTHGLLKFLDEMRRQGGSSDTVPIHSAIRPLYTTETPDNDEEYLVRWVYDASEPLVGNNRQPASAPSPDSLIHLNEVALDAFSTASTQRLLQFP